MKRPFGQLGARELHQHLEPDVIVGDAAARADFHVHQRAEPAERQAQQQDRADQRQQADAAGPHGRQFLVGAEPAKHQQRGRQHAHRQREHPGERDQQTHRLHDNRQGHLPIHQQRENLLQRVAEQQHEGEHHHGDQQRRQNLAGQICVQRSHGWPIVRALAAMRNRKGSRRRSADIPVRSQLHEATRSGQFASHSTHWTLLRTGMSALRRQARSYLSFCRRDDRLE